MQRHGPHPTNQITGNARDLARIARPESVVILAATVRAAREPLRGERIEGLKERVSEGGYAVSSKDLAQRVLATNV
jgi:anti-sigma28 factor (negative regulator of flagellin synthesis)